MRTPIKKNLVFTLICLLGAISSYAQFTHPGILHNQESFEYMKNQVDNRIQPAYGSFEILESDKLSSSSYDMRGPFSEIGRLPGGECPNNASSRDDFLAAYRNALMWKLTGNTAHAEKAEEILVAYANTLTAICGSNDALLVGLRGFYFVNAAEIMRDYMSASDLNKVQAMFTNVFVPVCQNFFDRDPFSNGNWGAAVCKGAMGYAVFTDNQDLYDFAKDWYLNGYDNGVLRHYVDNIDGQNQESGRDQHHGMLGIGCLAESAEVAYNQGDDLYSGYNNDNRLLKGFEYIAKYNLGNSVPYYVWDDITGKYDDWPSISDERRGQFRTIFEMAHNHYVSRMGMSMPWTEDVLAKIRPEGEPVGADHPGYGSLLFTYNEGVVVTPPQPPSVDGTLVHITKRNATGFAIDGGSGGKNRQNVTLSAANPSDEGQLWVEIDRGNGFYSYEKYGTNYSLDGSNGGATRQSIYLWQTSATNQNQQWLKQAVGDGGFKLIKRNATGFAINGGSGGVEGRDVNMWSSASTNQNLQWYITPINAAEEVRLEAEDYDSMSGIQTENSTESGENVGYINNGDWLRFDNVNLSGITNLDARVATRTAGGTLEVRTGSANGTLIGSINVGNTGGYQNWRTLSTSISNASGTQDVYLVFKGGNGYLFNVNWIEFNSSSRSNKDINTAISNASILDIYPNPSTDYFQVQSEEVQGVEIYTISGELVKSFSQTANKYSIESLSTGIYLVKVTHINGSVHVNKLIKQ